MFVNVYVSVAPNRIFVSGVTAVNVPAVVAAVLKITDGDESGSEPDAFVIVSALNAEPLVMVPESVCCADPARVTVPELWVNVPLLA